MAAGRVGVLLSQSIRASSRTRSSPVTSRTPVTVTAVDGSPSPDAFVDDELHVRERGDLREVGDDDDLGAPRERREPPTYLDGRLGPDPRVDLVEQPNVGSTWPVPSTAAVASATSIASMTRDSSPPDAPSPSGRAGAPACATSENVTASTPHGPGSSARSTSTTRLAPPIASPRQSVTAAVQLGGGPARARP